LLPKGKNDLEEKERSLQQIPNIQAERENLDFDIYHIFVQLLDESRKRIKSFLKKASVLSSMLSTKLANFRFPDWGSCIYNTHFIRFH